MRTRLRASTFLAGVGLAVVALLTAGCTSTSTVGGFASGDGTLTRVPVDKRVAAPRITGETLTGAPFDSNEIKNKVIVYNVWGSWCAPCRQEAPELAAAAKETADTASFVGINTRDSGTAQAQALVREAGIEFPSVYDPDGRTLLQFESVSPNSIPTTIVVDAQGRVAARILGATSKSTLVGLVQDTAAGK